MLGRPLRAGCIADKGKFASGNLLETLGEGAQYGGILNRAKAFYRDVSPPIKVVDRGVVRQHAVNITRPTEFGVNLTDGILSWALLPVSQPGAHPVCRHFDRASNSNSCHIRA